MVKETILLLGIKRAVWHLEPPGPGAGGRGRRPGQAWLTRVLEFRCNAAEEGLAAK